ncbi:AMIN domain-containing protein [Parahaliea mediterranea]|uniref:AMIN domain-containing protein n=1 Tax=Parahaliea mediterranea TaxID=651086 RepID=A0A939DH88_9GAMM|nr:AMIN domain-containing protein [Parahaliea mediterranea]MBN7797467.1 AMIN domain-containing protein [Parahaliea mediterranea]
MRLSARLGCWIACLLLPAAATAGASVVERLRLGLTAEHTRLVFDLSEPLPFHRLQQPEGQTLLLDLAAERLDFDPATINWAGTPVSALRLQPAEPGEPRRLRLSLRQAVSARAFVLGPDAHGGDRLVLDIKRAEPASRSPAVPRLRAVREGWHEGFSRLTFEFDDEVAYEVSQAEGGGPSLAIAFADAMLEPAELASLRGGHSAVAGARLQGDGAVEMVLAEPRRVRDYALAANATRGYRVVLDFYPPALQESAEQPARVSAPLPAAEPDLARAGPEAPQRRQLRRSGNGPRRGAGGMPRRAADSPQASRVPWEFSGTWEQEWAVARDGNQKFEALLDSRVDLALGDLGSLSALGRLRLDAVGDLGPDSQRPWNYSAVNGPWYNDRHAGFDLREFYLDTRLGNTYLRLGKQQVVWGQADGIKVLDVVNPQSFREYILDDFDDSRIPLWMANLEIPLGDAAGLQLLWIPDTTYHEFAEPGTPFELSSPLLVPVAPPGLRLRFDEPDIPGRLFADSDAGLRLRGHLGGWDLGLHYLYSYGDFPVLFQSLARDEAGIYGLVEAEYRRNHLAGVTASNVFGPVALRTELAWNSDTWVVGNNLAEGGVTDSREFSGVVGLDWQWRSDRQLSAQWFHRRLSDHRDSMYRRPSEDFLSLLWLENFANNSWEWRALGLYSVDDEDAMLQLRLRYWWRSDLEVWVGADWFDGEPRGLFGQFDRRDRLVLGLRWGF